MPRPAAPRKRYRPHPVRPDAVHLAADLVSVLSPQQQADLVRLMQQALDTLRRGAGGWAAWCGLADALNVAEALCARNIASNLIDKVVLGQCALRDLHQRVTAGRGWTLRGPEIAALDEACWVHEVQLRHASQGEVGAAIQRVQRVVRGANNGGAGGRHVLVGQLALPAAN